MASRQIPQSSCTLFFSWHNWSQKVSKGSYAYFSSRFPLCAFLVGLVVALGRAESNAFRTTGRDYRTASHISRNFSRATSHSNYRLSPGGTKPDSSFVSASSFVQ